jgi:hypothetical protein
MAGSLLPNDFFTPQSMLTLSGATGIVFVPLQFLLDLSCCLGQASRRKLDAFERQRR